MITIAELFPFYSTSYKWLRVFREGSTLEKVRLEKEYTIVHHTKDIENWWIDGKLHRTDGPSSIGYYKDGNIHWQDWYVNGKRHRTDGPARIGYYEDGNIHWQDWYINGKWHRTDGPASIGYYENGDISWQSWYENGEKN